MSELSADLVERRLKELSELSVPARPRVDMSPGAVERRLRLLGELHRVCVALMIVGRKTKR